MMLGDDLSQRLQYAQILDQLTQLLQTKSGALRKDDQTLTKGSSSTNDQTLLNDSFKLIRPG